MAKQNRNRYFFILFILIAIAAFYLTKKRSANLQNAVIPVTTNAVSSQNAATLVSATTTSVESTSSGSAAVTTTTNEFPAEVQATATCYGRMLELVQVDKAGEIAFNKRADDTLLGVVDLWYYDITYPIEHSAESTHTGKFIYALAIGDLLHGIQNEKKTLDRNLALKLLNEVHLKDPKNSAPLAHMAIIYDELKQPEQAKKIAALITSSTDHFDSYLLKVRRAILSLAQTPADYVRVTSIEFALPSLDQKKLINLMTTYKIPLLAEQMMVDGLNPANEYVGLEWDQFQYAAGCGAMKKLDNNHKCLSVFDLEDVKAKTYDMIPTNLGKNCTLQEFESSVNTIKKVLEKYK